MVADRKANGRLPIADDHTLLNLDMALSLRWHYPGQVLRVVPIRRGLSAWLTKLPLGPTLFSFHIFYIECSVAVSQSQLRGWGV